MATETAMPVSHYGSNKTSKRIYQSFYNKSPNTVSFRSELKACREKSRMKKHELPSVSKYESQINSPSTNLDDAWEVLKSRA